MRLTGAVVWKNCLFQNIRVLSIGSLLRRRTSLESVKRVSLASMIGALCCVLLSLPNFRFLKSPIVVRRCGTHRHRSCSTFPQVLEYSSSCGNRRQCHQLSSLISHCPYSGRLGMSSILRHVRVSSHCFSSFGVRETMIFCM